MIRLALALVLWAGVASAAPECEVITYEGNGYTICRINVDESPLRLFLYGADDRPLGHFEAVNDSLAASEQQLSFAMNAGMYHADRSPVGLYVENGQEMHGLITSEGPGNFGLLPNGVLCLREDRADVMETLSFQASGVACEFATQSGPMLVIDGALHPRFLVDSDSRYVRNGVGTSADGREAVFAISTNRVTFHEFGTLFRNMQKVDNALYFDGNISRLHAPMLGRSDFGFLMGPIIGTVTAK